MTTPEPLGKSISIGMSKDDVLEKLGSPNDVHKIVDEAGTLDQYTYWHYDPWWGWQKDIVRYVYIFNGKVVRWSE
jgi:hypothetical protein